MSLLPVIHILDVDTYRGNTEIIWGSLKKISYWARLTPRPRM